jgi:hypothetical protein
MLQTYVPAVCYGPSTYNTADSPSCCMLWTLPSPAILQTLPTAVCFRPQSTQSAGPVRFLIFCTVSIIVLASLVAGRRPQCNAGAVQQGMYSSIPIHWDIKSAPASSGRSRVGSALYVFSLLALDLPHYTRSSPC